MSLRDTIKGAAEEAQETVASVASKKSQKESEKSDGQTVKYAPRKSAASAKPSREAAAYAFQVLRDLSQPRVAPPQQKSKNVLLGSVSVRMMTLGIAALRFC